MIADAFFMSFKAYKGRIFLLGVSDLSVGTLSNWADRLTAMVEHGDDIGAIRLAVAYYHGSAGKVSIGLSEDAKTRHEVVRPRVLELLDASMSLSLLRITRSWGISGRQGTLRLRLRRRARRRRHRRLGLPLHHVALPSIH